VRELLEIVGLPGDAASRYPHEFSGGQRQRIGLARSLALNPDFIVCDEPVSALDVSIQAQILNLLRDLQGEMGVAYLFISHDIGVVRVMSDRIAVMREGKVVETGPADTVHGSPREEYTRSLLAAVPVADPALMAERRAIRAAARRPTSGGVDPRLRA
jgi:ABC-type oligopeptide transport system ATPase subunit